MAKFNLVFNIDNAAFEGRPGDGEPFNRQEITRILRDVAGKVERRQAEGNVLDSNGNTVGEWFLGE